MVLQEDVVRFVVADDASSEAFTWESLGLPRAPKPREVLWESLAVKASWDLDYDLDNPIALLKATLADMLSQDGPQHWAAQDAARYCRDGRIREVRDLRLVLGRLAQKRTLRVVDKSIRDCLRLVPINLMPTPCATMLWIAQQEDEAGRNHGRRLADTPTASFVGFLEGSMPGVVLLCGEDDSDADIVAYAVGEISGDQYEIVCSWVHEAFRGMGLALSMYHALARDSPASEIVCDMVLGSPDRLAKMLPWGLAGPAMWLCIRDRRRSRRNEEEEFERLIISAPALRVAAYVAEQLQFLQLQLQEARIFQVVLPVAASMIAFTLARTVALKKGTGS